MMRASKVVSMALAVSAVVAGGGARAVAGVSAGGFSSDGVEWIRNVPVGGFTEGGRLVGRYLYVTDDVRGLVIFDVSDPERPVVVGELNLPHGLENEDLATNGRIALVSQVWATAAVLEDEAVSRLHVVDVRDPTAPRISATIEGAGDHAYECLLDCAWAYGSTAADILDLRAPADPRIAGNWKEAVGIPVSTLTHDTTEVAPGRLLVAGDGEIYLLDTSDPARPVLLARSEKVPNSVLHTVQWATRGARPFVLSSTESTGPAAHCSINDHLAFAYFRVWDASHWQRTGTLDVVAEYGPRNGMLVDGDPVVSARGPALSNNGCATHWFEAHPAFEQNGLVALGAYGHGMKLLEVSTGGAITEKGYFLPHADDVGAAYWVTDRIVYSVSFVRGIDVLRYTGPIGVRGPSDERRSGAAAGRGSARATPK